MAIVILGAPVLSPSASESARQSWDRDQPQQFRILLQVNGKRSGRSYSPVSHQINFQAWLRTMSVPHPFDPGTVEVLSLPTGERVPHRIDALFGAETVTLNFVMPGDASTNYAVYFDCAGKGLANRIGYSGLIGDGDNFAQPLSKREIAASHFDHFTDFDGDGDLDLFKGGVEPFVFCWENVGGNRMIPRGRLASGGKVFILSHSPAFRSWVTVAFFDVDRDGDQDFFPSFGDGPDAGKIVYFENVTARGGELEFKRIGPLRTESGAFLAGGSQAGGWFPSITFGGDLVKGRTNICAVVGSNHRGWVYRLARIDSAGLPIFGEPQALWAGGAEIVVTNPRFEAADMDGDGDLDLLAATQPGPVHYYENLGGVTVPRFAVGRVVAWDGKFLIGDAHSGVKIADWDGDRRLDFVSGRFWERTDLQAPGKARDFGGLFRNVGGAGLADFVKSARHAPFTLEFQKCDAIRQNCVRTVDWDEDGILDLLAGDTDGLIWVFRGRRASGLLKRAAIAPAQKRNSMSPARRVSSQLDNHWRLFEPGEKLKVAGGPLNVTVSGGHARFDICDWNSDGRKDLVVADGSGGVTLFEKRASGGELGVGQRLFGMESGTAFGNRASALTCDWDNDGRLDLVMADERRYYFCRNTGTLAAPVLAPRRTVEFRQGVVGYVRPNLGSFVDWDGDGKRDLIGAHFENSIRFYKNLGSGKAGALPEFGAAEGLVILEGQSPQMISGADAIDWNGDGDLDILTGQGHGGSGLRFFERDWIEDELGNSHPAAVVIMGGSRLTAGRQP